MEDDLQTKILKEVTKTGYPVELRVGSLLSSYGWGVDHNKYYLDMDEHKGREIDISAFISLTIEELCIALHLVCEVKHSNKPWVVFSTEMRDLILEVLIWSDLNYGKGIERRDLTDEELEILSPITKSKRIGRSYCECFKKENEKTAIFEALTSVVKASEYCLERNEAATKEVMKGKYLHFIEPVIIFDGLLYDVHIGAESKLEIQEIEYIPISFGYISPTYKRRRYLVHLLTEKMLPIFESKQRAWIKRISNSLQKRLQP